MRFEDHFLPSDIPGAMLTFSHIVTCMQLIDSYIQIDDHDNAAKTSLELTKELKDLHEMACRKNVNNDMYLHHLLTQPQGWYPA